jgi:hypothetical protein
VDIPFTATNNVPFVTLRESWVIEVIRVSGRRTDRTPVNADATVPIVTFPSATSFPIRGDAKLVKGRLSDLGKDGRRRCASKIQFNTIASDT